MTVSYRDLLLAAAVGVGVLGILGALLWWAALLGDWEVVLVWNRFGEQWIEGIGLHLIAIAGIWLALRVSRSFPRGSK